MEKKLSEKKRFSIIARIRSANHAWRGLGVFIRTTHNFKFHIIFGVLVLCLGFVLNISSTEWIFIVIAIGFVLVAETFNTAIEIDIDLTSPEYHPYAKDTKDVSAGAVLLSVGVAVIIGLIIFLPKIIDLLV